MSELTTAMEYTVLKQEVSFKIDKKAEDLVMKIQKKVKSGKNLKDIAHEFGDRVQPVFDLSISKDNSDGGGPANTPVNKAARLRSIRGICMMRGDS